MNTPTTEIHINALTGLSITEATRKIGLESYNELPSSKPWTGLATISEVWREPMFLLLIVCGAIYIVWGDLRDAAIMSSCVFIVIGITFYQESKSEHALEALRDLSSPSVLVIHDSKQHRIIGRDMVSDDILILAEGDHVPDDSVLLQYLNLSVDGYPDRKSNGRGKTFHTGAIQQYFQHGRDMAFLSLILTASFLRDLFSLSILSIVDTGICLLAGGLSIMWFDWLKRVVKPMKNVIPKAAL